MLRPYLLRQLLGSGHTHIVIQINGTLACSAGSVIGAYRNEADALVKYQKDPMSTQVFALPLHGGGTLTAVTPRPPQED